MAPQVAIMVEQMGSKKRQMSTRRRKMARGGYAFESTAEALALPQKPKWARSESQAALPEPMSDAPLAPGEKREAKTYRARSLADIWPPLVWSLVSGGLVGIAGGFICTAAQVKWFWPVGIWFGATAIAWFVSSKDLLDDDKLIATVQEMVRAPEPKAPIVEAPAAEIVIQSADGKVQKRAKLHAPASNHAGLWQYADALVRNVAAPSYEGGEHVYGAKAYGYTPDEFDGREDRWRPVAIRGGLLEEDPHKSKGYRLTENGRRALAQVAEHRLGEWG